MQKRKAAENSANFPNVERDEWNAEDIAEESVNQMPDESLRQILRGDETDKDDADSNDFVGGSQSINTPQGREEAKIKNKKI